MNMNWFKLIAPVVGNLLTHMAIRAKDNLQTTKQGAAISVTIVGLLEVSGCHMDILWEMAMAALAGAPSVLATDPGSALPTLVQVMKDAAKNAAAKPSVGDAQHEKDGGNAA